jgi:cysteinyl-tRNA synthetase
MHGRFLRWNEDDQRMSKSSGQFLVVSDLVERGFDPLAFRYHCLTASYRVPLTFSWAVLESAADGLCRLRDNVRRLHNEAGGIAPSEMQVSLADRFRCAISDDFNAPRALAATWETVRQANRVADPAEKHALLQLVLDFDRVLGLRLADAIATGDELPAHVAALIEQRETARAARDWSTADALRETIRLQGYEVEDTPSGTRWRLAGRPAPPGFSGSTAR